MLQAPPSRPAFERGLFDVNMPFSPLPRDDPFVSDADSEASTIILSQYVTPIPAGDTGFRGARSSVESPSKQSRREVDPFIAAMDPGYGLEEVKTEVQGAVSADEGSQALANLCRPKKVRRERAQTRM